MPQLTLYTNPASRGRIARWMLEELGQPYETVLLGFGEEMGGEGYRRINPMGKVPCVTHGDRVVTEAAAICAYLAQAFPQAGLLADDMASYYRWMFFASGPFEQASTNAMLKVAVPKEMERTVGYGSFERVLDALEAGLSTGKPYVAGDRFSAADVYVASQVGWGMHFGSIPARKAFTDYWGRVQDRPAAIRAREIDDALMNGAG